MASRSDDESGPRAVGLLALRDKDFFQRLLEDPRAAIESEKRLEVSPEGIRRVQELIEETMSSTDRASALAAWERYHDTGLWGGGDWQGSWGP